jgi:type IV pilus assembly protein PilP
MSDLKSYVEGVKARKAGWIKPVPEFKTYSSYLYSSMGYRSPFQPEVVNEFNEEETPSEIVGTISPDFNRNRETLESFPLDSLRFVGTLESDHQLWAIIVSPDNLVHRVKEENYLGQNFGRVVTVTESHIELLEMIKDIRRGWIERETTISLIEE